MRRIDGLGITAEVLENPGALRRMAPGARGRDGHEPRAILTLPAIDPIEHEQVKVHVEIERTAESLYQGHGSGHRARARQGGFADQRKAKEFRHERLGLFTFYPLAIQRGSFLELVRRVEANGQSFLVAEPLRALMDLVCLKKVEWQGLSWIEQGLRVDADALNQVTGTELRTLKEIYKHERVRNFIGKLEQSLELVVRDD